MHRDRGMAKKCDIVIYACENELTMATCINSDESAKRKTQKIIPCDTIHIKFKCTRIYKIDSSY